MNAKCNDFSVCNDFLCIFIGKTALGLFFLVFSTFVVLSILKDNFQVPLLAKCSVFPVIRPANRLNQAFLPYLRWFRCHYLESSQVWIIAFERVEIQRFYMNIMAVFVD